MVYKKREIGKRIEPMGSRQQLVQKDEVQQIFDQISAYLEEFSDFMGQYIEEESEKLGLE